MKIERLMLAVAVATACGAGVSSVSHAQTTTATSTPASASTTASGTTSATAGATSSASTTATAPSTATTASGASAAQAASSSESQFLSHVPSRFVTLAGSSSNLQSLVHGLRTGSAVTLTSTQTSTAGTPVTQSVTFTPPTRPMGYGNITRALTLASRELAAAGIRNPTPQQLQTALTGGTITTAQGTVKMPGVLQLRSQGMGWGQIAHTIGVPPGKGTSGHENGEHSLHGHGITTATGAKSASTTTSRAQHEASEHSLAAHRGIVTASGTGPTTVQRSHPVETHAGTGIVTATGAASTGGIANAAGRGAGQALGHESNH
jgi:hypothetical protein